MGKTIIAYVPVVHRGYLDFLCRHVGLETDVFVLGEEVLKEFRGTPDLDYLRKDMRALRPEDARSALAALHLEKYRPRIYVADIAVLNRVNDGRKIVMPDDEISRGVCSKYLNGCEVLYDPFFLRWESRTAVEERNVCCEKTVSFEGMVAGMMSRAFSESAYATNLWRHVGAVIARDGHVLLAGHNTQIPSRHTPYYEGDARMFFKQGLHFELTTDIHAEALLIATAAKTGTCLEGSDLFITTFPCPPCAKLVARSGLKRCYFATGYAVLDGERIMKDYDLEIIQVVMPENV